MKTVVVVVWYEFELGWGSRPDGYSVHKNVTDKNKFIDEYWDSMPSRTPNEYSVPDFTYISEVDEEYYNSITGNGLRFGTNEGRPKNLLT